MLFVPLQGLNHSASVAEWLENNTRSAVSQGLFRFLITKRAGGPWAATD
jgi:hypothetical protein